MKLFKRMQIMSISVQIWFAKKDAFENCLEDKKK